jgi:hypothetical protein
MKLIATANYPYKTRHLKAGDPFETASQKDGELLIKMRRARPDRSKPNESAPAPVAPQVEPPPSAPIDELLKQQTEVEADNVDKADNADQAEPEEGGDAGSADDAPAEETPPAAKTARKTSGRRSAK